MADTTETQIATCPTHGTVQAERRMPRLGFPFILTLLLRYRARLKPFRCPECGSPVT